MSQPNTILAMPADAPKDFLSAKKNDVAAFQKYYTDLLSDFINKSKDEQTKAERTANVAFFLDGRLKAVKKKKTLTAVLTAIKSELC